MYTLVAGSTDDEKRIGCRAQASPEDTALDVDLYDAVLQHARNPVLVKTLAHRQARLLYRAAENSWWLQVDEPGGLTLFVNNLRAMNGVPLRLSTGDVLSIGPTVNEYYVRLEVELTAKKE
jgi:hypothetical protein